MGQGRDGGPGRGGGEHVLGRRKSRAEERLCRSLRTSLQAFPARRTGNGVEVGRVRSLQRGAVAQAGHGHVAHAVYEDEGHALLALHAECRPVDGGAGPRDYPTRGWPSPQRHARMCANRRGPRSLVVRPLQALCNSKNSAGGKQEEALLLLDFALVLASRALASLRLLGPSEAARRRIPTTRTLQFSSIVSRATFEHRVRADIDDADRNGLDLLQRAGVQRLQQARCRPACGPAGRARREGERAGA